MAELVRTSIGLVARARGRCSGAQHSKWLPLAEERRVGVNHKSPRVSQTRACARPAAVARRGASIGPCACANVGNHGRRRCS